MKILITGGCGYVGSEVVKILHQTYNVTVLDNFMQSPNTLLPYSRDIKVIKGDIRDYNLVKDLLPKFDSIIHLAAIVGTPACEADRAYARSVNVDGTQILLELSKPEQIFVFVSTSSCYGKTNLDNVTEDSPLNPLSTYAETKAMAESFVKEHPRHIIFRPGTSFGISGTTRIDLLPNTFMYEVLSGKKLKVYEPFAIRPCIHIHNFARAIAYASILTYFKEREVYNLSDPDLVLSKGAIAEKICKAAGVEFDLMDGSDPDKRDYNLDVRKLLKTYFYFLRQYTLEYGFMQFKNAFPIIQRDPGSFILENTLRKFRNL